MTEQSRPQPEQKTLKRIGLEILAVGVVGLASLAMFGPLVVFPITGLASEVGGGVAGAYAMILSSGMFFAVPAAISLTRNAPR